MTYYNYRGVAMPETEPEQGRIAGTSAGNETMNAPNAPGSSVSGEGGGDLLVGNNYGNRFWITDTRDRISEPVNGGIDTEIGWTSLKLADNVENLQVNGNFSFAWGNNLANLIVVDDNTHWVYGAGGDDVLVGAASQKTTFVERAGEGSDVIYNWNGNDQVQLVNYGFKTAAQVRGAMTQQGSDVLLNLGNGESLTFRGTTLGSFQDRQFLLPLDTSKLGAITFSDDFNSLQTYDPSLQTGIWSTNFGGNLKDQWAYSLPSNGEKQAYTGANFYANGPEDLGFKPLSVANGVLTIHAQPIPQDQQNAAYNHEFSSGMINTLGTFEQQYGYFEMRAEVPTAVGTWPAFWMMPTPYTAQTEADIMESLALTPNVDYRRAWGGNDNLYDNGLKIDPTGMHTYGMLWTPQTVTFYFDGYAVLQANTPSGWTQPMGLILNMAVGGWGGDPNASQFPADMKIDYVHVYNLADNSAVIEHGTPETPAATLRTDGGTTSGQTAVTMTFDSNGQALSSSHVAIYGAKPTALPPGQTFVVWQDSGAVFGAVSDGHTLGTATTLMAGSSSAFTGAGTWLTDGRVVVGYMAPSITGQSAWALIYNPADGSIDKHQLGVSSAGNIGFTPLDDGAFAASWTSTDGSMHGRAYDAFAYDGKGWYGPERQVTGAFTGFTAGGDLIAQAGGGQQLYSINQPAKGVSAVVSVGPMAGVSHPEGNAGAATAFTFTVTRDFDLSQKSTVGWKVTGQGAHPADALDFVGGGLPSGVVSFEINQATATVTVQVQGDNYTEGDEQFLVTLVNPVGAKLGQATATGFITEDGDTGGAAPPPPSSPPPPPPPPTSPPPPPPPPSGGGQVINSPGPGSTVTGTAGNDTITASQGADVITGGAGADTFAFKALPWAAGHVTDFVLGTDRLDFSALFQSSGYSGTNPVADGRMRFEADGAGGVRIYFDHDAPNAGDWPFLITTLDHVSATGLTWAQLSAGGASSPPPSPPPPPPPPPPPTSPPPPPPPPPSGSGQVINSPGPGSTVTGTAGNDTITASQGADVITGAAGADAFVFKALPWSAGHITDFQLATDHLDFSAIFQAAGYSGTNPVADGRMSLQSDGAGGTKVFFDRDAPNSGDWPFLVTTLDHVSPTGLTWAQLSTGGASSPPPSPPPPPPPPPPSGGTPGQTITSPGPGSTISGTAGNDTIKASQGADVITGAAGADRFVFQNYPWNAGHITDFTPGTDKLDLSGLFAQGGYSGADPIADHRLEFRDDGHGNTQVYVDRDAPNSGDWPFLVTTLDHVSAAQITSSDWIFR